MTPNNALQQTRSAAGFTRNVTLAIITANVARRRHREAARAAELKYVGRTDGC